MIKADPLFSSGIRASMMDDICLSDGISFSPGRRRMQCAVTTPKGGTITTIPVQYTLLIAGSSCLFVELCVGVGVCNV